MGSRAQPPKKPESEFLRKLKRFAKDRAAKLSQFVSRGKTPSQRERNHIMKSITKIIVTTAIAALSVSAAQAQTVETKSVTVRYGDLNLNTQAGQSTLALRIHRAATTACGNGAEGLDISGRQSFKACYKAATDQAMVAVNAKRSPAVALGSDQ
jgi:UrcA family protein